MIFSIAEKTFQQQRLGQAETVQDLSISELGLERARDCEVGPRGMAQGYKKARGSDRVTTLTREFGIEADTRQSLRRVERSDPMV